VQGRLFPSKFYVHVKDRQTDRQAENYMKGVDIYNYLKKSQIKRFNSFLKGTDGLQKPI